MIDYCLSDGCCKPTIKINDAGHMSTIEKLCYLIDKVGEIVVVVNGFDEIILNNQSDIEDLYNELSKTNSNVLDIEVKVDSNTDQIQFITSQFEEGATGLVIDGGFAGETEINKQYDGGVV